MADSVTIRVNGLSELVTEISRVDKKLSKEFRDELRVAGTIVATEMRDSFYQYSPKSAAAYVSRFRRAGVIAVETKLRKTTGKRPDWGRLQQQKLDEAGRAKHDEVEARLKFACTEALGQLLH